MKEIKVLLFNIDKTSFEETYLFDKDRDFLSKFKVEKVRKEKALSLMLKNKFIGEYYIDENGKPLSKSKYFNISHKDDYLVLVIDEVPIGVDIEHIKPVEDDLINFISNEEEKAYIKDAQSFFEIWTNKEAIVKANGKGIKDKIPTIPSLPINGQRMFENKTYTNRTIKYHDYIITVSRESDKDYQLVIEEK